MQGAMEPKSGDLIYRPIQVNQGRKDDAMGPSSSSIIAVIIHDDD
jgi:hypothetical protein